MSKLRRRYRRPQRAYARIEQEPGSAGVIVIDHYARHVLQGRDFRGVRSTGSKAERARPLAAAISNGLVSLRSEAPWVRDLTNEMRSFPLGTHDDQVDAMSGSMTALTQQDRVQSVLPRSMVHSAWMLIEKHEREIGRTVLPSVRSWGSHCRERCRPHVHGDTARSGYCRG